MTANSNDLTRAVEELERDVSREVNVLKQKEMELQARIFEKKILEDSIRASETQIKQDRTKLTDIDRKNRVLTEEISKLKRDHAEGSAKLSHVRNELQNTLRSGGVKIR